ncbi:TetR/AcrR family transcriptional regulator [Lacrimispora sp. 38-1]|uniref:TetR/AcrR family transcriptional regulator n=1 Tax=Lacrimispora sp. 38-1 TaxID=3125778 RepID=UPI003CF973D2
MDSTKEDRRVKKTKKQLLLGLTELMQKKKIRDITVRELTDIVDINRGTFYLHYKDIYDMVDQIEDQLFTEFNSLINKHTPDELKNTPFLLLNDIFTFISNNADTVIVLTGNNGNITFFNKVKNAVRTHSINNLTEVYSIDKKQIIEYYASFQIAACIALVEDWLKKGMKESPEEMAFLAKKMLRDGINVLK